MGTTALIQRVFLFVSFAMMQFREMMWILLIKYLISLVQEQLQFPIMTVTYTSASYSDGYVLFEGLQVKRDNAVIAKMPEAGLVIRVMTADETGS